MCKTSFEIFKARMSDPNFSVSDLGFVPFELRVSDESILAMTKDFIDFQACHADVLVRSTLSAASATACV